MACFSQSSSPEIPGNPAVVLVHPALAFPPVVELAGSDVEPPDEPPGADLRLLRPAPDKIHYLVPRIVRNPDPGQSSPSVFFSATCSAMSSASTSSLVCVRRRSTPRGTGSWRRRDNSVRFVGSTLREKAKTLRRVLLREVAGLHAGDRSGDADRECTAGSSAKTLRSGILRIEGALGRPVFICEGPSRRHQDLVDAHDRLPLGRVWAKRSGQMMQARTIGMASSFRGIRLQTFTSLRSVNRKC